MMQPCLTPTLVENHVCKRTIYPDSTLGLVIQSLQESDVLVWEAKESHAVP